MTESELKEYILNKSKYFNMKEICAYAGVNYTTFRGWKNGRYLSEEKLMLIYEAMHKVHLVEDDE